MPFARGGSEQEREKSKAVAEVELTNGATSHPPLARVDVCVRIFCTRRFYTCRPPPTFLPAPRPTHVRIERTGFRIRFRKWEIRSHRVRI